MYSNMIGMGAIILVYYIWVFLEKIILEKLGKSDIKVLNMNEYLPEEEISTLRQVFYLAMMFIFFIFILYTAIYSKNDIYFVSVLEIIVLTYVATTLDYSNWKGRILSFLILPFGSFAFFMFHGQVYPIIDLIHIIVYVYLIILYYQRFKEYTEANSLGIAILLLFSIIFFSFVNTTISEGVSPLDALVMVSNAFTSNGYAILGHSDFGKLNSIFLVWGGYILSGVGTATLTVAILLRHFNKRIDELEKLIKEKE